MQLSGFLRSRLDVWRRWLRVKRRYQRSRGVLGLVLVLSAVAWGVIVWGWPGLHLLNDAGGRGLQPAVLVTAASIEAAVIVFSLAVGAIALQVMTKYSWAVVRSVLPGWFIPVLAVVVGGGVVFPLWVSFSPTQRLSTAAFAAFGWAVLLVGATVWDIAQRMNPPFISTRARWRALTILSLDPKGGKESDAIAEVLGQLAADAELPYGEGLRVVGSYAVVLADRARHGSEGEVAAAVRSLGDRAASVESAALASGVVRALWVLGLDQVGHPRVLGEARRELAAIGAEARRRSQRDVADAALDALASLAAARVGRALPPIGFRAPPRPVIPPPPPRRSEAGFFPPPVFPSSLAGEGDHRAGVPAVSRIERLEALDRLVDEFVEDRGTAEDLAATLSAALPRREGTEDLGRAARDPSAEWYDYELLRDTVDTLVSLLPSPQPSSTGWPTGWQGHGVFDADVQRLASVADGFYRQGKHVPSDLVETALEEIGVRLRAELPPAADLPFARTGWRYPPVLFEEGGIAAVTAQCLGMLMSSAFDAGFDRRALSSGLRILASATASAEGGDRDATVAYVNALIRFTLDTSLHGLEAQSQAGRHRVQVVLIGVISECDQLLDAARRQKEHVRGIYEAAEDLALALAWNTPSGRMFDTVIAMLQARLIMAGWPVGLPSGQRRAHELDEPLTPPPARPLPAETVRDTEKLLTDWTGHPDACRLTAAALVALWAHAACALRDGSPEEAQHIAIFLTEHLHDYDERYAQTPAPSAAPGEEQRPGYQALDPRLRRLISAAARWCARADPSITPTIPRAAGPRTVRGIARGLVSHPATSDWIYKGSQDTAGTNLVTVLMPDRSRRVLRDRDVRTGDLTWGYSGSGPHGLSSVLLADILADLRWCRDCLGVIPLAADMITCTSCFNTGMLADTMRAQRDLLAKVISELPDEFERTRLQLLHSVAGLQPGQTETP